MADSPADIAKRQADWEADQAKRQLSPEQKALLSKIHREAQDRDFADHMRELTGVNIETRGVDPNVLKKFDAHGISGISAMMGLLQGGVDPNRNFYSSPLSESGRGASNLGTGVKGSSNFIALGHAGKTIKEHGIGSVVVEPLYSPSIPDLQKMFPHVKFIAAEKSRDDLATAAAGARDIDTINDYGTKAPATPPPPPKPDPAAAKQQAQQAAAAKAQLANKLAAAQAVLGTHADAPQGKSRARNRMPETNWQQLLGQGIGGAPAAGRGGRTAAPETAAAGPAPTGAAPTQGQAGGTQPPSDPPGGLHTPSSLQKVYAHYHELPSLAHAILGTLVGRRTRAEQREDRRTDPKGTKYVYDQSTFKDIYRLIAPTWAEALGYNEQFPVGQQSGKKPKPLPTAEFAPANEATTVEPIEDDSPSPAPGADTSAAPTASKAPPPLPTAALAPSPAAGGDTSKAPPPAPTMPPRKKPLPLPANEATTVEPIEDDSPSPAPGADTSAAPTASKAPPPLPTAALAPSPAAGGDTSKAPPPAPTMPPRKKPLPLPATFAKAVENVVPAGPIPRERTEKEQDLISRLKQSRSSAADWARQAADPAATEEERAYRQSQVELHDGFIADYTKKIEKVGAIADRMHAHQLATYPEDAVGETLAWGKKYNAKPAKLPENLPDALAEIAHAPSTATDDADAPGPGPQAGEAQGTADPGVRPDRPQLPESMPVAASAAPLPEGGAAAAKFPVAATAGGARPARLPEPTGGGRGNAQVRGEAGPSSGSGEGQERFPLPSAAAGFGGRGGAGRDVGDDEARSDALAGKMDALTKAIEALTKVMEQNGKPGREHAGPSSPAKPGERAKPTKPSEKKAGVDPALIRQGAAVIARAAAGMFGS